MKNLLYQRFGRLVVIGKAERRAPYTHMQWWHCMCDCGNQIDLPTYFLTSGKNQSCGCLQRETRLKNISGKTFHFLTAIRPTGEVKDGSAVWQWQCACGKIVTYPLHSISNGSRKSCGCMRITLNRRQGTELYKKIEHNFKDGTNIKAISSNKIFKNNSSGVRGVSWHPRLKKWQARITFRGKTYHLGYFTDLDAAALARAAAEKKFFASYLDSQNL